ncbi:M36 family metallopeptidase [Myxococcota bacterium]|nr:M36 family metallopeptidase [Myxococcota bacterium]
MRHLLRLFLLASFGLFPFETARAEPIDVDASAIALDHLRNDSYSTRKATTYETEFEVRDQNHTRRTGVTSVHVRQKIEDIEIHGADITVVVGPTGDILHPGRRLTHPTRRNPLPTIPTLSPHEAVEAAARHLGLRMTEPLKPSFSDSGPQRRTRFNRAGLSRDEISVALLYFPRNGELHLAWGVVLQPLDGGNWWHILLDSTNGEVLAQYDWIEHESYRAFDLPLESPDQGNRNLVTEPSDPIASPFGWHDTNGVIGAEFTDTRGNNARAQEDSDANNVADTRPDGGAGLSFDIPLDFQRVHNENRDASVVQLFYMANRIHDLFYAHGFDEANGNFQANNYGRGGVGGDPVLADTHDAADTNNARFGTPPEGTPPRMELFLFSTPNSLTVNSPTNLAGTLSTRPAAFGLAAGIPGVQADLVRALDAANNDGPATTDGCSPFINSEQVSGNIALIDRGTCFFVEKVENAQDAGAVGAVIANNAGDAVLTMAGTGDEPTLTIPSFFIGQSDGEALASEISSESAVNLTLRGNPNRDSAFDAGIIAHEYGHGVTERLTGGASNVDCLNEGQNLGLAEGWSDFFGLAFTTKADDQAADARPIGTYLLSQPPNGPGIRTQPYSTDLVVNNLTFADIASQRGRHGIGEVWANTLWEVYWNLVHAYGFDPELGSGNGGNQRAMDLVLDGLKLQNCNPTFLEARDALLLAENAGDGTQECLLWAAFAKRGMGASASDAGNPNSLEVTEAFDMPPQCSEYCGDGIIQTGETCEDGNLQTLDGCSSRCRIETALPFSGTANGGRIVLTLSGVSLEVTTLAGDSATAVANRLAQAILADPSLVAMGVTAVAVAEGVVTDATVDAFTVEDTGLAPPLPALPGRVAWGAALLTSAIAALKLRSHRAGAHRSRRP